LKQLLDLAPNPEEQNQQGWCDDEFNFSTCCNQIIATNNKGIENDEIKVSSFDQRIFSCNCLKCIW